MYLYIYLLAFDSAGMYCGFTNCVFSTRETNIEEYFNYLFIRAFDGSFLLNNSYFY
jgi:hypothetical protein